MRKIVFSKPEIESLASQGLTQLEIAKRLSCSKWTIQSAMKALGISPAKRQSGNALVLKTSESVMMRGFESYTLR